MPFFLLVGVLLILSARSTHTSQSQANGPQAVQVPVASPSRVSATRPAFLDVLNIPAGKDPAALALDVTGASFLSLSPTEIFVGNLTVNGQRFDTRLQFDPVAEAFQLTRLKRAPVLVGAGDIAVCGTSGAEATAKLLDQTDGTVFTTGDNAYEKGSEREFLSCYGPTWGRHKARTRPSPGNHEYKSSDAAPYFSYFGDTAGPSGRGYYSYDLGEWHLVSLNSAIPAGRGSDQERWLLADLAAHPTKCTLAYWHRPVFSSGKNGNDSRMHDIWHVLYQFRADVVVNGHDHIYERFLPQTPDGTLDEARGIREFVVGTGGSGLRPFKRIRSNSEVRDNSTHGVLKLTLHEQAYSWEFVPAAGGTFTDAGTALCVP